MDNSKEIFERQDNFLRELKDKYPLLYKQRLWVEFSYGWYDLIRNLSFEIYELYNKWGSKYNEYPYVIQMKEKFGGLRYYMTFGELEEEDYNQLREVVEKYERLSYNVCEICSEPGKNGTLEDDGWYITLCEACKEIEIVKRREKNAAYSSNKI